MPGSLVFGLMIFLARCEEIRLDSFNKIEEQIDYWLVIIDKYALKTPI
jgi:hypothetical protein